MAHPAGTGCTRKKETTKKKKKKNFFGTGTHENIRLIVYVDLMGRQWRAALLQLLQLLPLLTSPLQPGAAAQAAYAGLDAHGNLLLAAAGNASVVTRGAALLLPDGADVARELAQCRAQLAATQAQVSY